jgi:hypothetical protein
MTVEQLKQVWKAEPIRPFTIHLADERDIAVTHRDFLMPSPSGRTAIVYQPDDSFNIIDLLLVTELEVSNGKSRHRKRSE